MRLMIPLCLTLSACQKASGVEGGDSSPNSSGDTELSDGGGDTEGSGGGGDTEGSGGGGDTQAADSGADPGETGVSWEIDEGDVGRDVGQTMADISLLNGEGEEISVWDLFGEYHILYLTAGW